MNKKHKVMCAICGKKEIITIINKKIPKDWSYFGKIDVNALQTSKYFFKIEDSKWCSLDNLVKEKNPYYDPKVKHKYVEYWECKKCLEKGE